MTVAAGRAPPRLLLVDNYDSFTYNLVQAFLVLGADVLVHRNDEITVDAARALAPTHLCISPGPGTPADAGVSEDMIRAFAGDVPVLGVCLGHQALVEVYGGAIVRAERLMHGKASQVLHDGRRTLRGAAESVRRRPLSLPDRAARRDPGRVRGHGLDLGRRGHGRAPQGARARRRAVPPGEHPHARGAAAARGLPAQLNVMWGLHDSAVGAGIRQWQLISGSGSELTFAEVLRGWSSNESFRRQWIAWLGEVPFDAYVWECPPVTSQTVSRAFECVFVSSPSLARMPADKQAFAEQFRPACQVVTFGNLGGDAVLVAPCPAPRCR